MVKYSTNTGICTIYLLINLINYKIYIGQTWSSSVEARMGKDGINYKNSIHLYNAIKKYGVENFQYIVLVQCREQTDADYLENYFIELYNSRDPKIGYNLKEGGSAGKHSEETKIKISETWKNKMQTWSAEEIAKKAEPISTYWKGKKRGPHTEEWKKNNSEFFKEWHANNPHPMEGKHHSEEAKAKMSAALTGRPIPPEVLKKRSETRRNNPERQERDRKIIEAYQRGDLLPQIRNDLQVTTSIIYAALKRYNIPRERDQSANKIGRKHSEETKSKMSMARTEYWEEKNAAK
jgi:group I intron endonuclease